jgi:hypothetical protein
VTFRVALGGLVVVTAATLMPGVGDVVPADFIPDRVAFVDAGVP